MNSVKFQFKELKIFNNKQKLQDKIKVLYLYEFQFAKLVWSVQCCPACSVGDIILEQRDHEAVGVVRDVHKVVVLGGKHLLCLAGNEHMVDTPTNWSLLRGMVNPST